MGESTGGGGGVRKVTGIGDMAGVRGVGGTGWSGTMGGGGSKPLPASSYLVRGAQLADKCVAHANLAFGGNMAFEDFHYRFDFLQ